MITKNFNIEGMSCNHCVNAVKIEISKLPVKELEVTLGQAKVIFDEATVTNIEIIQAIEEAGFKVA